MKYEQLLYGILEIMIQRNQKKYMIEKDGQVIILSQIRGHSDITGFELGKGSFVTWQN